MSEPDDPDVFDPAIERQKDDAEGGRPEVSVPPPPERMSAFDEAFNNPTSRPAAPATASSPAIQAAAIADPFAAPELSAASAPAVTMEPPVVVAESAPQPPTMPVAPAPPAAPVPPPAPHAAPGAAPAVASTPAVPAAPPAPPPPTAAPAEPAPAGPGEGSPPPSEDDKPTEAQFGVTGFASGPEFVEQRQRPMGDETPQFNPQPVIEPLRDQRAPGVQEFMAKPTGVKGRSPINLQAKGTRRALAVVAAVAVVLLVMNLLPKSSSGATLALTMAPGDTMRYAVHLSVDGTVSTNGGKGKPYSADATGLMTMTVTDVGGDGSASADVEIAAPGIAVTPPPRQPVSFPKVIRDQVTIGSDGTISGGSPGLAALVAATQPLPAGWDAVFPSLPSQSGLKSGATWSSDQTIPFADTTVSVGVDSKLLSMGGESGGLAVIETERKLPFEVTTTMSALLGESGLTPEDLGMATDLDLEVALSGDLGVKATYWVNAETGTFDHSFADGTISVKRVISGLPKTSFPGGTLTQEVEGTAKLWVDQAAPEKAAEPKADSGQDAGSGA